MSEENESEIFDLMRKTGYTHDQAKGILKLEQQKRIAVEESAKQTREQRIEETLEFLKEAKLSEILDELLPLQKQIEQSRKLIDKVRKEKIEYTSEVRQRIDMMLEYYIKKILHETFETRDKQLSEIEGDQEEIEALFDTLISKIQKIAKTK
jgi:glutamyl-tRNA reductase